MNILIAYYSETGNTKKIAQAIHDKVLSQGSESHLKHVNEITIEELHDYDIVFLGSACHDADLAMRVKRILKEMTPSPSFKLAGFVTHAVYTPEGGDRQRKKYNEWAGRCVQTFERVCQEKEIKWCGFFSCQGAPSPPIKDFIHREIVVDEKEWAEYLAQVRGRPNEDDLEKAREFAQAVLRKQV